MNVTNGHSDGLTDILTANATLNYVARQKIIEIVASVNCYFHVILVQFN